MVPFMLMTCCHLLLFRGPRCVFIGSRGTVAAKRESSALRAGVAGRSAIDEAWTGESIGIGCRTPRPLQLS
jgi:hypothetical protein